MKRLAFLLVLSSPLALGACGEGQIDKAPAAKVKDPAPKADAKADGGAAKADGGAAKAPDAPEGPKLDMAKSTIGFVGAKVTAEHEGKFAKATGSATIDGDTPTKIELTVPVDTLEIEPPDLHKHLLSPDLFDAEAHPEAKFVSSSIKAEAGEGTTHVVEGDLTLHGVTKTISFPATVQVTDTAATGKAEFKINRKDFGIVYPGMPDDLIKDDVLLKLDLTFTRG